MNKVYIIFETTIFPYLIHGVYYSLDQANEELNSSDINGNWYIYECKEI